jgi:serine/threonine protein phosphatase PrpC
MQWKVFFASAAGKYHLDGNTPCQDSGHHVAIEDILVGVVCDGAGSASEGHVGSDFFARKTTELIFESITTGQYKRETQSGYREYLLAIIQKARSQLNEIALSQQLELRDFACTVVGCITSRDGGCFFHIGDGFAICVRDTGESVLSHPENGEYADETYFVTDDQLAGPSHE